jgi:tRNA (mo5U34)-methyltransferase
VGSVEDAMQVTQEHVAALRWFHSMDLGNGIMTRGTKRLDVLQKEADIVFRHGVTGKTVLDIGACDGWFSFEAERRGAARVVAADYRRDQRTFLLARSALGSRAEIRRLDLRTAEPAGSDIFDVVLLLGVLYHLKSPLDGLERAAKFASRTLVVETITALNEMSRPAMLMFERHAGNDWWMPNIKCVEHMLETAGFQVMDVTQAVPGRAQPRHIFHAERVPAASVADAGGAN